MLNSVLPSTQYIVRLFKFKTKIPDEFIVLTKMKRPDNLKDAIKDIRKQLTEKSEFYEKRKDAELPYLAVWVENPSIMIPFKK